MNKMKKKYEVPLVRVVEMEAMVIMAGSDDGDENKVQATTDSDDDSAPALNWGGHIPWKRRTARLTVKDEKNKDYEETIQDKDSVARGAPVLCHAGKCL